MRLFTYTIPVDDGAAPNPYWGVCTLAICKPVIQRVAQVGDWVVGLGSKNVAGYDYSGKIVYAMKVTRKKTMKEYDEYCQNELPNKIPDVLAQEYERKVGDCIYDFAKNSNGNLRNSVHTEDNKETDLGGKNVLLSDHFYYFGDQAIDLPSEFNPIFHQGQGHKSNANDEYKDDFVNWIINSEFQKNKLLGNPQLILKFNESQNKIEGKCAEIRCKANQKDEEKFELPKYNKIAKASFKTKLEIYLYSACLSNSLSDITPISFNMFEINEEIIHSYVNIYWEGYKNDIIGGKSIARIEEEIATWKENNKPKIKELEKEYVHHWKNNIFPKKAFNELLSNDQCEYCKVSLAEIEKLGDEGKLFKKNYRGWTLEIDRKKPNYEYTPENTIMACYWCNNAKTDEFSNDEFLAIGNEINKIWNNRLSE